jgi:hypothetical protein
MIGITGYTIFIDIAVKGEGNQVWAIMHGPVSVVLGILAGLIAAYLCAFTKLWNNRLKRTAVVLLSALFMKFIFDRYNFTSGGALGSLTLGLCVKELWARGKPGIFAIPETNHEYTRNVSVLRHHLCVVQVSHQREITQELHQLCLACSCHFSICSCSVWPRGITQQQVICLCSVLCLFELLPLQPYSQA